jgi:hypothetical protein
MLLIIYDFPVSVKPTASILLEKSYILNYKCCNINFDVTVIILSDCLNPLNSFCYEEHLKILFSGSAIPEFLTTLWICIKLVDHKNEHIQVL